MAKLPKEKLNGSAEALAKAIQGLFEEVTENQSSAFVQLLEELPTKGDLDKMESRIQKEISTLRDNTQEQFRSVHENMKK